jgi:hypothetical protein
MAHLNAIGDPAILRAELAMVRERSNGVRLHAGIGDVTPTTSTRVAVQRSARRARPDSSRHASSGLHGIASIANLNHPRSPAMLADRSAISIADSETGQSLLAVVIALSIMLAGCTGDEWWPSTSVTATTAAPAATPPPPPPAEQCGGPTTRAQSFWLTAPGGAQVYAAVVGTGPVTAVFVHEAGPRGLCGFWPYADWLARTNGVRSVLFSQCGAGASQCPPGKAADQWLR